MLACQRCEGFVPQGSTTCPNCGEARSERGHTATRAAACAAMMMTLMACYGGGYDGYDDAEESCNQPQTVEAGSTFDGYAGCTEYLQGQCVGAGAAETVVDYQPYHADEGLPGKLDINWTVYGTGYGDAPRFGVYVRDYYGGGELGCAHPDEGNTLSLEIDQNRPLKIVIDGAEPDMTGRVQLHVSFRAYVCGDGWKDGAEACDDGNLAEGDGCSPQCTLE